MLVVAGASVAKFEGDPLRYAGGELAEADAQRRRHGQRRQGER